MFEGFTVDGFSNYMVKYFKGSLKAKSVKVDVISKNSTDGYRYYDFIFDIVVKKGNVSNKLIDNIGKAIDRKYGFNYYLPDIDLRKYSISNKGSKSIDDNTIEISLVVGIEYKRKSDPKRKSIDVKGLDDIDLSDIKFYRGVKK